MLADPKILKSLYFWSGSNRGSNSYWFQQRGELEAMVNQRGIPTAFLTLSAADLWWPDLARLMGSQNQKLLNNVKG